MRYTSSRRRLPTRRPKRTKTEGKTLKNGLPEDGEKAEPRQEDEKKEKPPQKRNLYYAELRASCFCPHFLVFLIRQAADRNRMAGWTDIPIETA